MLHYALKIKALANGKAASPQGKAGHHFFQNDACKVRKGLYYRHTLKPVLKRGSAGCGRSSVVEHDLAKVGVASSSLVARSNQSQKGVCWGMTPFLLSGDY